MTAQLISGFWFVATGLLMYVGWDYWIANALVVAALSVVMLGWFHVKIIGGNVGSLCRLISVDLAPMVAAACFLLWLSHLSVTLSAAALVFAGVVFVITGVIVRQVWDRYPNYHASLRESVRAIVLSAFGYPIWNVAHDGSFVVPVGLTIGLGCFVAFAIKSGWDASLAFTEEHVS